MRNQFSSYFCVEREAILFPNKKLSHLGKKKDLGFWQNVYQKTSSKKQNKYPFIQFSKQQQQDSVWANTVQSPYSSIHRLPPFLFFFSLKHSCFPAFEYCSCLFRRYQGATQIICPTVYGVTYITAAHCLGMRKQREKMTLDYFPKIHIKGNCPLALQK